MVHYKIWCIIIIILIPLVAKLSRIKSNKNLKLNSWMAKGLGRRHSQMTRVAKLHWNAAKWSKVAETRIVPPCRWKRITRFCGPNYSGIPQPIHWLGLMEWLHDWIVVSKRIVQKQHTLLKHWMLTEMCWKRNAASLSSPDTDEMRRPI